MFLCTLCSQNILINYDSCNLATKHRMIRAASGRYICQRSAKSNLIKNEFLETVSGRYYPILLFPGTERYYPFANLMAGSAAVCGGCDDG